MAMKRKKVRRKRRKSNPGLPVLFANPRKRKRVKRRKAARKRPVHRRRRKIHAAAPKRRRVRRRRTHALAPIRHRRRRRRSARHTALAPRRRRRAHRRTRSRLIHRRRANPLRMKSLAGTFRLMLFGGLGIIGARLGKRLYTKYAAPSVLGAGGSAVRGYLNDALTVAAMAGFTYAVDRGLRRVPMVKPNDALAFQAGGYAEAGRHAIALIVQKVRPSTSLANYGLDGYTSLNGVYGLQSSQNFMGNLEEAESFQGMGDLEPIESFEGPYDTSNI